jgi:hypothetical protein
MKPSKYLEIRAAGHSKTQLNAINNHSHLKFGDCQVYGLKRQKMAVKIMGKSLVALDLNNCKSKAEIRPPDF